MATQADGEGSLCLKKQEPPPPHLLICILTLMTWVGSLVAQQPLASFHLTGRRKKKKKGGNALERRRGGHPVAMAAHHICLCAVYTSTVQNTIRKRSLFTSARVCSVRTKSLWGGCGSKLNTEDVSVVINGQTVHGKTDVSTL